MELSLKSYYYFLNWKLFMVLLYYFQHYSQLKILQKYYLDSD